MVLQVALILEIRLIHSVPSVLMIGNRTFIRMTDDNYFHLSLYQTMGPFLILDPNLCIACFGLWYFFFRSPWFWFLGTWINPSLKHPGIYFNGSR